MPDQDPKVGGDPLRPFLDPLQVDNSVKSQAWQAWHNSKTSEDFQKVYDNLPIPQATKSALWKLKFQPPIETADDARAAIARLQSAKPPAPLPQPTAGPTGVSKGDVRPSEGAVHSSRLAAGTYQKRPGGALLEAGQDPAHHVATGIEQAFGIKPAPDEIMHPYLDAYRQAMTGGAKLMEDFAKDPINVAHGLVTGISGAVADVQSGLPKSVVNPEGGRGFDARAIAHGVGQLVGLGALEEKTKEAAGLTKAGRGETPTTVDPWSRENRRASAMNLMGKGYTGTEIEGMSLDQRNKALTSPVKLTFKGSPTPGASPKPSAPESSSSTRMGPVNQDTEPLQVRVPATAPIETRAESATGSVSADPTVVVAPKPFSWRGQAAPIRPYDPFGKRFAKGGTIGMDPINVQAMVADPVPGGPKGGINPAGMEVGLRPVSPEDQAASLRAETEDLKARLRTGKGTEAERQQVTDRISQNAEILKDLQPSTAAEVTEAARKRDVRADAGIVPVDPQRATEQQSDAVKGQLGFALGKQFGVSFRGLQRGTPGQVEDHLTFWDPQSKSSMLVPLSEAHEAGVKSRLEEMRAGMQAAPPAPLKTGAAPYRPKSWDVPQQIHGNFEKIAELTVEADIAESDKQSAAATAERARLLRESEIVNNVHIGSLTGDQLLQLRDGAKARGERLAAQSKAIRDLTDAHVKNQGVKSEIGDLKASGGPVRKMVVDDETGERAVVKPEERAGGPAGREVLREAMGRRAPERTEAVVPKPEGVGDEEFNAYVNKLNVQSKALKRQITDKIIIAKDTGVSLDEAGVPELLDQLKQLEELRTKFEEKRKAGADLGPEVKLDEQGAIKAEEPVQHWTLARAQAALGRKVNKIPTPQEFYQHADRLAEHGRLWTGVSEAADKTLKARNLRSKGERGSIGEVAGNIAGHVKTVSLASKVPDAKTMLAEAKRLGLYAIETDIDHPALAYGWMSPDGKIYIHNGPKPAGLSGPESGRYIHNETAKMLLPDIERGGSAQRAMIEAGWIRRAGLIDFQIEELGSKQVDAIETALLRDGNWGGRFFLDTRMPNGRVWSLGIEKGWEDINAAIARAKKEAEPQMDLDKSAQITRLQNQVRERGRIPGVAMLGAATLAAGVAGAIGYHLAGPHGFYAGGAIGYATGFMTPAIARKLRGYVQGMVPVLRSAGTTLHDWLYGPRQKPSVLPNMATIRNAQIHDIQGPRLSLLQRLAQLPGNMLRGQDDFYLINDRTSAMGKLLMAFDQRGEKFRDLRGQISVDDSPYVAAWLAQGGSSGMQESHLIMYKAIYKDGQASGLMEHITDYLNLKGYQRAYRVMAERIHEYDSQIAQRQQAMMQPNLHPRNRQFLQDQVDKLRKLRQAVVDKIGSGEVVPAPYTPTTIIDDLTRLQQQLSPAEHQAVVTLANRLFNQNRAILDMIHDEGLITDDAYQKYVGRGNEYIPMNRILEDISETNGRIYGKTSPLYLRQQNVVKALNGSDRVNRNPWIASADAALEAAREVMRNNVMKKMLRLASQDPQGVGSYFRQVPADYKPKVDEGLIGVYEGGQVHTFAAPSWLAQTMQGAPPAVNNIITKVMGQFGKILRAGATVSNTGWSVPNAMRHFQDMALMSDAGLKSMKTLPKDAAGLLRDWIKNINSVLQEDPSWLEYLRSGAGAGVLQRMITPEEKLSLESLGFKQKLARGRLLKLQADFNKAVEDVTKLTTYKRLRMAGLSETAAAWETRRYGGGPDFAKQGNMTRELGIAFMFFNAHLQYTSRAFSRLVQQPQRMVAVLGALTMLNMALAEHNFSMRDEKGNQLIRKVSFTDRENNFVILLPGTYESESGAIMPNKLLVPKGSLIKFISNPIENAVNKIVFKENRTGIELGLRAASNLLPGQFDLHQGEVGAGLVRGTVSSMNPVLRVPAEELLNETTTGEGRPIVPGRQTGILPEYQSGEQTSAAIQRMGKGGAAGAEAGLATGAVLGYTLGGAKGAALGGGLGAAVGAAGVSPRRLEHIVRGTTSGVGEIATGIVDPFFGGVSQTRAEGPDKLSQTPIIGPIIHRFTGSSMDQEEATLSQQFYEKSKPAKEILASLKYLEMMHPDQVEGFMNKHGNEIWKGKMAEAMEKRLNHVGTIQQRIMGSQGSDADKKSALKNLHDAKLEMLKAFVSAFTPSPQKSQVQPGEGQGNPNAAGKK